MLRTFKSRQLAELWRKGSASKIDARLQARILVRLDALDSARIAEDINQPGFDFHTLRGFKPKRYTVHVNGPWCVTFEFENGDAFNIDFEQYH
ncbi:MAG: type II toxin-antitoxin system RelE/ParE family toxin [Roseiarcus sp.]